MAPSEPRRRGRPGHDQDAVLAAAAKLFTERGYDYTGMIDIAVELGIAKSSVYHHISSKEQMLQMVMDRALDGLFEAADEVRALDVPALERLEQLIRRSVLVLSERFEYVCVLLRVRGNTAVEQHALERRREFDGMVTELVKQAQAEGGVRPDVDPPTAARLLLGMVNSLTEWYRPRPGGAEAIADAVTTLAFEGLRT
ncbi:TetR/AcrR family transcriptional regulator [Actinoplanes solisilvae]|uniref:TetR/AcrR family transcriptional regulator n=1 Tax=Actinoplanes solisilvae TaxID=2486853 RepID=UPI000FDBEFD4|nr:TetR/AcrR family transcriptional regulator [Actinoplanes solisilvae]